MRAGRLTLFLVGAFLIGFAIFIGKENTQVEGAIFGLLTGVVQMSVIHYLIAKIIGPVLFGRMWCGWACWTVMVLDLLPFKRPTPPPELCSTVVSCEHLDMSARVFLRCQVFPNNTWCLRDVFERAGKHSPRT
jgi:polyferredoxin